MGKLQSLFKDTVIYGLSSIVGRFLNYLLVPLYSYSMTAESGNYGIVTNVYAWTALILVMLTFGFETTFMRFAGKYKDEVPKVFSTSIQVVATVCAIFLFTVLSNITPIANALGYEQHPEFITMMSVVISLDAIQAIAFTYLRFKNKAIKFASLKLLFIGMSIALNLVAFLLLPYIYEKNPSLVSSFYEPNNQAYYIFLINLICTSTITLFFIPEFKIFKFSTDIRLLKEMLSYSWPILLLGLAGILNLHADKIIYPILVPGEEGRIELSIYGAVVKIAAIMAMLIQAFKYAYEPIVFKMGNSRESKEYQAIAMKYFIAIALLAFLAVVFYMDILRNIIAPDYWVGLSVVPIVMLAEIIMGVYQNLSNWYKLNDETWWGAIFSTIGCIILFVINIIFVPQYGYHACAIASLIGFTVAMLLSYFVGQYRNPIMYDLKSIFSYVLLAMLLYKISQLVPIENSLLHMGFNTILIFIYLAYFVKKDLPLKQIPIIKRFFK